MAVSFFLKGLIPSGVGGKAGGAANVMLVMPLDLSLQELVGGFVVRDFFVSQEGDQAVLKEAESALDFAFGGSVGGDPVGGAQSREGTLELGVGVHAIGSGLVTEKAQAVGVKAGGWAKSFHDWAEVGEVGPGCVAGSKGAAQKFAGMVIQSKDQSRVMVCRPPLVRRGIMLPEFADGRALPAAAGFWTAFEGRNQMGKMLAHKGGHRCPGALETELPAEFLGQERKVQRLTMGDDVPQEIVGGRGPGLPVIAAGKFRGKSRLVPEPSRAQAVKLCHAQVQALGGGVCVQLALIEGADDLLHEQRRDPMS